MTLHFTRDFITNSILFIAFFCITSLVYSQEPVSIHFSEKNGLPDKEFYDILEDENGFIWLAADKGLFRYDGKTFKSYTNDYQRGLSVFNLQKDHLNRVWCNNISGQFFYIENNQLKLFADLSNQLKGELSSFIIHKEKLIVFAIRQVYEITIPTKKVKALIQSKDAIGIPFKWNDIIYFDNANTICYFQEDNSIKQLLNKELPVTDANGITISQGRPRIFKIKDSTFLMDYRSNRNTFFEFNITNQKFNKAEGLETIANKIIYSIFENGSEVWFSTNFGVWVYEFSNNEFRFKNSFLTNYSVTKILKDSEDNYWFTSKSNGVFIVPSIHIESHSIIEEEKIIVDLEKIDNNTLAFGTAKGNVGFYNIMTKETTYLTIPSTHSVSSIKYIPHKELLIISKDLKSYIYDFKTNNLKENEGVYLQNVKSFTLIHDDLLYTTNRLASLLKRVNVNDDNYIISSNKRTYASHFNKENQNTYIAYVDNLYVYDSIWNPRIISYKKNPIFGKCFAETSDGINWVGTFKNGLFGIKNGEVIHHYKSSDGLNSNKVNKIRADKDLLWIALDNSIQLFDSKAKTFKTLTKSDGVLSYDITGIEVMNNEIYFSSNEGLFSLNKEKVFKSYVPEVYFTAIEINEAKVDLQSSYQLDYDQNALKIGFHVNGLYFNEKGYYQYRLKGFKEEWSITDTRTNFVNYNSLPAGNYVFQVKPFIKSENGNLSEIKELKITISKPIWERWWFIGVIGLLILMSINFYYRRKIKNQEKERAIQIEKISLEKELVASNLKALRSQMNPHFIFNSLNSIQDLVLKEDTEASYDYIVLFANLIRNTLNYSNKDFIPLEKELEFLKIYLELEKLRFGDDFKYEIDCSIDKDLEVPSLLIQPFIENALVHGLLHKVGTKHLSITFQFINSLECIVTDNGIGRKKAQEIANRQGNNHESFALKAIEQRLNVYQKMHDVNLGFIIEDLVDNNGEPSGTKTTITMPFKKNY